MHPALVTVLDRIAAREGCDRSSLPPLYEAVDPDAVIAVLESNPAVTVRFEYAGYRVEIGPGLEGATIVDEDR
ncbi:HalOD1 output domain-containing protein [Halopiger goleimassiliensis]|uniref:HalOD1 output domain-containing protein n=1 Tax=Halopiger goleimassiliensis TaxID=1293048 RepID=UPI0006782B5E|nr:HalOD1 output domain-containing protein [Halopiger goleimassiliensis]